jgi:putative ABC transport system permease protein
METLLQDLRFAGRTLLKRPVFTVIAVLTLALGIGANTAIFSVVDSVLLQPLPFKNPERLMMIWASNPELAARVGFPDKLPVSPGAFYDWKESKSFEKMAMVTSDRIPFTGEGEPELLGSVAVSGEFFQVLGTPALIGRTLLPADDEPGKGTTVVLSHAFWMRRFGGDRGVIGKTIRLSDQPMTIVGVMPPSFEFPRGGEMPKGYGFAAKPEIWTPLALPAERRQRRGNRSFLALGLLKPGVGLEAAQAEMSAIADRIEKRYPDSDMGWRNRVEPLPEQLTGDVKPALLILLSAVGLVLLIACVNVANLLLAQAAARQKEIAVRTALGAGRGRMVRQLLTESALLALLGGGLGLLLAFWGLKAFSVWIPEDIPVSGDISLDLRILGFTLLVTLLTGMLAGLVPAFQMTRPDLSETLREGTRAGSSTSKSGRTRSALVIVETAVAVLLVVGAGLLLRSFARLTAVDPGFRPEGVLTLRLLVPQGKYENPELVAFTGRIQEGLRALPGVTGVGMVSNLPMSGEESIEGMVIEGKPQPKPEDVPLGDFRQATAGYFQTMGIPLIDGRLFTENDHDKAPPVAVIDETLARAYWPGENALGKRFRFGGFGERDEPWITVVGIVGNVRNSGLHVDARPQLYVPQAQNPSGQLSLVVRTAGDPKRLIPDARAAVFAIDPNQPIDRMRTMEEMVSTSVAGRRFNMVLLVIFAGLALVLAAVGIYGITSYSVAQRTREMGLRMALGARPGTVLGLVLREAGTLALLGLGAGLVLAFAATRVMSSLLFGVGSTDPATFAAVSLGLAAVSLFAAYLPGRRATQVDPMVALRAD